MNRITASVAAFVLLIIASRGLAQVNDAGLWLSGNVEKQFSQSFSMSLSEELRLMENVSEASTVFTDLGLEYRLNKHFRIAGHYRFINDRRLDNTYRQNNRLYLDLSYRRKFKPVSITLRERIQSEYTGFNTGEEVNPEIYLRTKAVFKLDLDRKITPYYFLELFHPLSPGSNRIIDKIRNCAGFEYSFNARHSIDLNYMLQCRYKKERENDYIVGAGYYLTL